MRTSRSLPALCSILAAACSGPDTLPTVQERIFAMGTWVDVTFQSPDPSAGADLLRDIESTLRAFERDYYPWAPGKLAALNAAIAAGEPAEVDPDLADLLRRAQALSAASSGYFEPGLGGLVELWGFHSTTAGGAREPPAPAAIAAALEAGSEIAALSIEGTRVASAERGLKIDLGGIAKGAAVERLLALMASRGIAAALVNAGGDLACIGDGPGDRAWRVGIRDPRGDALLGIIDLADGEAAFTSGDYERYYEHDGQRMHHLLDPDTGRPVAHTRAVTVVDRDPVLADAAATALFVAGPARWRETARSLGVSIVLRVGADGTVETTEPMAARLRAAGAGHDTLLGAAGGPSP